MQAHADSSHLHSQLWCTISRQGNWDTNQVHALGQHIIVAIDSEVCILYVKGSVHELVVQRWVSLI